MSNVVACLGCWVIWLVWVVGLFGGMVVLDVMRVKAKFLSVDLLFVNK